MLVIMSKYERSIDDSQIGHCTWGINIIVCLKLCTHQHIHCTVHLTTPLLYQNHKEESVSLINVS